MYEGERLDDIGLELLAMITDWEAEVGGRPATARSFIESMYDRQRDTREGDRARLVLSTLHAAKGLEFDHVVLLGAPTSRYATSNPEALEEERRLFYVGMTRAKNRLWLIDQRNHPSPFVREVLHHAPPRTLRLDDGPVKVQPGDRDVEGLEVAELGLDDLWTSFPARGARGLPGEVIEKIRAGDRLELHPVHDREGKHRVSIRMERVEIGMFSRKGSQRFLTGEGAWSVDVQEATVAAVVIMDRLEGGDEPVERWELMVPRILFRRR